MDTTETLKHEHKVVLLALEGARREMDSIQATGRVNAERVEQLVDFLRNFTDKCHHAKEEDVLFKKMMERGMTGKNDPIDQMLREHTEGRRLVGEIATSLPAARAGDAEAIQTIGRDLQQYVDLLQAHIYKEDNILYPMATRLLTPEDMKEVAEAFERVETEEMGAGTHEKYHQMAHDLAEK